MSCFQVGSTTIKTEHKGKKNKVKDGQVRNEKGEIIL